MKKTCPMNCEASWRIARCLNQLTLLNMRNIASSDDLEDMVNYLDGCTVMSKWK